MPGMNAGSLHVNISGDDSNLQRVLSRVNQAILKVPDSVERAIGKIGHLEAKLEKVSKIKTWDRSAKALDNFGKKMVLAGSAGIALTGAIAKVGMGFEQIITEAAAISGKKSGFTDAFNAMSDAAINLSTTTKYTATEIGGAFKFLSMAGQDAATAIAAMPHVLRLAAASGTELARSADIVTNIMASYGKRASEMGDVNNVLIGTFTNSNVSLEQLAESFRTVGSVAKTVNLDIEEVAATLGVLGNAGEQGAFSGQGLKMAIAGLVGPTKKSAEALRELGIDGTLLVNKGFIGVIKQMEKMTAPMLALGKNAQVAQLLFDAFGSRAGPRMAVLLGQGSAAVESLLAKIRLAKKEDLAKFIEEKQLSTLSGTLQLLSSSFDALVLSLGQALMPVLKAVFLGLKSLTDSFNALPKSTKHAAGYLVVAAGAASVFAVGLGAVAWVTGNVIGPLMILAKTLGMSVTTMFTKATVAALRYAKTLSLYVVGAAAAFAAGFGLMYGAMELFGTGLKKNQSLTSELGYAWETFTSGIEGAVRVIGQAFIALGTVILKALATPMVIIPPFLTAIYEMIDEAAMDLNDSLIEMTKGVEEAASATNALAKSAEQVKQEAEFKKISEQIGQMANQTDNATSRTRKLVDQFAKLKKAVNEVVRDWNLKAIDFELRPVADVGTDINRDLEKIAERAAKAFRKVPLVDTDKLYSDIATTIKAAGGLDKFKVQRELELVFLPPEEAKQKGVAYEFVQEFKGWDKKLASSLKNSLNVLLNDFEKAKKNQKVALDVNAKVQLEIERAQSAIFAGMITQLAYTLSEVPVDKFNAALAQATASVEQYQKDAGAEKFIKFANDYLVNAIKGGFRGLDIGEMLKEGIKFSGGDTLEDFQGFDFLDLSAEETAKSLEYLTKVIVNRAAELSQIRRDEKFLREALPPMNEEVFKLQQLESLAKSGEMASGAFSDVANKAKELAANIEFLDFKLTKVQGISQTAADEVIERQTDIDKLVINLDILEIERSINEELIQFSNELSFISDGLQDFQKTAKEESLKVSQAFQNLTQSGVHHNDILTITSKMQAAAASKVSAEFLEAYTVTKDFRDNIPLVEEALLSLGEEGKQAAERLKKLGPAKLRFEDIEEIPVQTVTDKITEALQKAIINAGENVTGLTREEAKFSGRQITEAGVDLLSGRQVDFGSLLEQNAPMIAKGITTGISSLFQNASRFVASQMPGGTAPLIAGLKMAGTAVAGATAGLSAAIAAIPVVGMVISGFLMLFDLVKSGLQSLVGSMIPEQRMSKAAEAGTGAAITSALFVIPLANALSFLAVIAASFAVSLAAAVAMLLPVIIFLSPAIIALTVATAALSAIVLVVIGTIAMLSAYISGLIYGPLVVLYASIMMVVGGAMLLFGLLASVAALIPETENFKKAMSALEQVANEVIKVIDSAFGDSILMLVGLFSKFVQVLTPVIEIFASGLASLIPILFEALKGLALFFLDVVIAGAPFFNFIMDLGTVLGHVFGWLARAAEYLIGAFTEGAKFFFQAIKWFADLTLNADLSEAAQGFIDGIDNFQTGVTAMVDGVFDAADALQNFKITDQAVDQLRQGRDELANLTTDLATEEGRRLVAEKDVADKLSEMNEELTNVPQGFKVAAARYNAIAVDQGRTPGQIIGDDSLETDGVRTIDNRITIENISLGVSNWRQFVDQLETEQRRRDFQKSSVIRFNDGLFNGAG